MIRSGACGSFSHGFYAHGAGARAFEISTAWEDAVAYTITDGTIVFEIGTAWEDSEAGQLTPQKQQTISTAWEDAEAYVIAPQKSFTVLTAWEDAEAFTMIAARVFTIGTAWEDAYAGRTIFPVSALNEAPYHVPIVNLNIDNFRNSVSVLSEDTYSLMAPVASLSVDNYTLQAVEEAEASFSQIAGFGAEVAFSASYDLLQSIDVAFTNPALLTNDVEKAWTATTGLESGEEAEVSFKAIYHLLDEAPLAAQSNDVSLKLGNQKIQVVSANIAIEEGALYWKGGATLANTADAAKFQYSDAVTLDVNGTLFSLLVDGKTVQRENTDRPTVRIAFVGTPAVYSEPRAAKISQVFDAAQTARSIVESLVGAVDWRIIDWVIPANRLGVEDAIPADIARQIVEAAGGVIESNPDGSIYVRYLYPNSVLNYATGTPDHTFTEDEHLFSQEESYEYFEINNRYRITDIDSADFGDQVEFIEDDDDSLKGKLHVYPSPYRSVTLRHTGPSAIKLVPAGEQVLTKTDQIEIIGGVGNLSYPILSIDSVEWEDVDLGGLAFVSGAKTVESTTKAESLVTVTYTTKAYVWDTESPVPDTVQFIVEG